MIGQIQIFKPDFGHIFDFGTKSPSAIFNEAILPRVNDLDQQALPVEPAPQQAAFDPFTTQNMDNFILQIPQPRSVTPSVVQENYDAPLNSPQDAPAPVDQTPPSDKLNIKLSNYGYSSDSSPDYNSNVLKIGHANNPLESGKSAALTKTLAERYGLKTGDMFEAFTASGDVLRRRYDDTVPTTYKGRKLPETVDLYDVSGSNNFSGIVTGIRPLSTR